MTDITCSCNCCILYRHERKATRQALDDLLKSEAYWKSRCEEYRKEADRQFHLRKEAQIVTNLMERQYTKVQG